MRIRTIAGGAIAAAGITALGATVATAATPAPAAAPQHTVKHHHYALGLNSAAARRASEAGLSARLAAPDARGKHAADLGVQPNDPLAPNPSATVPSSADLSQYALTPGDQGQVGSCVTWATGYSAYGLLMNEQGISGAPMAPMYIYSQIAQGNDTGTEASVALPMEQNQGIDTQADYWQGTTDYTTQPDANETANAAQYKLSGFEQLPLGADAQAAVESAIAQGMPVVIGTSIQQSFEDISGATATNYTYTPGDTSSDPVLGGHELAIVGYNDQGVRIENSWGASWGDSGFVNVPWSFVTNSGVDELNAVGKLAQN